MQVVHVAVAGIPPACGRSSEASERDRCRLRSAGDDVDRHGFRLVLPAAHGFDRRRSGRKLEIRVAGRVEVVPVDVHHRPMKGAVGTVRSLVAGVDVDARGHRLAVGAEDANVHATRRRHRTSRGDLHLVPRRSGVRRRCDAVYSVGTPARNATNAKRCPSGLGCRRHLMIDVVDRQLDRIAAAAGDDANVVRAFVLGHVENILAVRRPTGLMRYSVSSSRTTRDCNVARSRTRKTTLRIRHRLSVWRDRRLNSVDERRVFSRCEIVTEDSPARHCERS